MATTFEHASQQIKTATSSSNASLVQDNALESGQPSNLPIVYGITVAALLINIISVALTVM